MTLIVMKDDFLVKSSPAVAKSYPLMALTPPSATRGLPRLLVCLILFATLTYAIYTLKLLSSRACPYAATDHPISHLSSTSNSSSAGTHQPTHAEDADGAANALAGVGDEEERTSIHHVVFGIAASARLWNTRKEYIKLWWRPSEMRGVVWLDRPAKTSPSEQHLLPPITISSDTSSFAYTHKKGHRSAIRISRIVSETLRLGLPDARWFVMGDEDTVFLPDNLIGVLRRLDHRQPYYVGSYSESHLQNIYFSYSMAYGGGGFAISRPLAVALEEMQDRCIQRYPGLYGSDDRMQACMAELGVPLTRHQGFHQYDVHGNLFGLLAAHPVTPLVSLHHLDAVEPIFPHEPQPSALQRLFDGPVKLDPAAVMQQSICYDGGRRWTVSVSWGFAVQVIRGVVSPREMEMPMRTFLNWYRRADYTAYAFNTRPVARHPCHRPFVYYLQSALLEGNRTVTQYGPRRLLGGGSSNAKCRWKGADPAAGIDRVVVYKQQDPSLWDRAPRRNCCRVKKDYSEGEEGIMIVDVGVCRDGEISEIF